jgi:hypothetical protein
VDPVPDGPIVSCSTGAEESRLGTLDKSRFRSWRDVARPQFDQTLNAWGCIILARSVLHDVRSGGAAPVQ